MNLKSFYLFYLLTFLLLAFGVYLNGKDLVLPGWHVTVYRGFWFFVQPTAATSFVSAVIYHLFNYKGKSVKTEIVIVHFILWVLGLAFIILLYKDFLFSYPDTTEITTGKDAELMVNLSSIFIIISFLVFIFGIVKSLKMQSNKSESNN